MAPSIRMLPQKEFAAGFCVVCGTASILKWRDTEVGLIGDCCYGELVTADRMLADCRVLARPQP